MKKIVGVDFNEVGKIYWFNPGLLTITKGTKVVVETVRGLELVTAVTPIKEVEDDLTEIIGFEVKIRIANVNYFRGKKGAFRTRNVKIPCYIAEVYL